MLPEKALNLAAGMCSSKESCSYDIRKKLEDRELPEKEITRILDFLYQNNFLDDSRFARFYARDKFRFNKWGKQKITQMLKQKGISSELIEEAVGALGEEDYADTCRTMMQQKLKAIKDTDPYKIKAKLIRFALGRGFDFDTINRCLPQVVICTDSDDPSIFP